jgi:alpha-L-rhamnosidase
LIGNESDAAYYHNLSEKVRERILFEYVTPSGRLSIDTQSGYIIALKFKLFREREVIIEQLKSRLKKDLYKIKSGFVGTPIFCQVLSENGMVDLAYEFLLNEGFPGWLYAVNLGATTIWERWNSVMPDGTMNSAGMNSLNHYSYGSVIEFVYKYVVGIQPLEAGFRTARLAPNPNVKLGYARGSYQSAAGKFVSEWKILRNGELSCYFEVPFGAQAEIELPYSDQEPIKVASGRYAYTYQPTRNLSVLYDLDTRLSIIKNENKELFEEILGIHERIRGFMAFADEEQLNLSLNQLSKLFYTGITAELVAEAGRLLKKSNRS